MNQDLELHQLMHTIAEKIIFLIARFKQKPILAPSLFEHLMTLIEHYQAFMDGLQKQPEHIEKMQLAYLSDANDLLHAQLNNWLGGTAHTQINDKRFRDEQWANHPFFNALSQHYLIACNHLNALAAALDDDKDQSKSQRLRYFMRQYLDALSPDNFLHSNPEVISETMASQGLNLLRGLDNFLSDIDKESLQLSIKMTDTHAFKLGETLACTPGIVIFKNDLMELIQYSPQTTSVFSIPLLIIPPWINKYYILDLSPHNSFVNWLVKQGITVFIISWANPTSLHANKGLYDYLRDGPIAAINVIQHQFNVKQVNALGFCIGGTLLAMLLAYYKERNQAVIKAATFLASMIDFSDPGEIAVFIDESQISKLEERMQRTGFLEGKFMANAFNSLRSSDLIWSFFINNYLRAKPHRPFDLLFWNSDSTNMPAKMHSQYLRWMYLNNDLIKPGKIHLNNTPLDVSKIDIPTFFIATQHDHIAPWKTIYKGFQCLSGNKKFLLGGSGHIAGIVIPPGTSKYGYYWNIKSASTSESWLKHATHHDGSWWPKWFLWLNKHSGIRMKSPNISTLPITALTDAPGSYVHVSSKIPSPPFL